MTALADAAIASIGVDNGGTSLRIKAVDRRGRLVFARSDPAPSVPKLAAFLRRTFRAHSLRPAPVLVLGSRGVWLALERDSLRRRLRGLALEVIVLSDVELAHGLFFRGGPGILLIAGTGSIAYGRHAGVIARAGGLGPRTGDEGSGYWIGRELLKTTGGSPFARSTAAVAALAPRVLRDAGRKDPVASRIVKKAARHLADLALDVARRLRATRALPVALHGGLFRSDHLRRRCVSNLREGLPGVRVRAAPSGQDAALRAALMGLDGSWKRYRDPAVPRR